MKKILVATDGSENALRAVRYAATLAKADPQVKLVLLHVLTLKRYPPGAKSQTPEELCAMYPRVDNALQSARQILDSDTVSYETRCRTGDPGGEIAAEASESACDAVVMGTRGMGPIRNLLVGSVASKVAHLVQVPLTLIK